MSSTITKRRYTRLLPAEWSEVEALWAAGDVTLAELANRFGLTSRALQAHFQKRALTKGSAAKAISTRVKARILTEALPDEDDLVQRAKKVRESAYGNAVLLEQMLITSLEAASKDPSATFAAATQVKMIGVAAQALERLHTLKRAALGLDGDHNLGDDLPILLFEDLSNAEIALMASGQDEDDADNHEESAQLDDVVTMTQ